MANVSQPSPLLPARQRAQVLADSGDLAGARAVLERAVELGKVNLSEDDPDVLVTAYQLGSVLQKADDPTAARRVLEEAFAAGQWRLGDSDPLMLQISHDLGVVAEELGNRHEARKAFVRVAELGPGALGADHWAVARARAYLGEGQTRPEAASPPTPFPGTAAGPGTGPGTPPASTPGTPSTYGTAPTSSAPSTHGPPPTPGAPSTHGTAQAQGTPSPYGPTPGQGERPTPAQATHGPATPTAPPGVDDPTTSFRTAAGGPAGVESRPAVPSPSDNRPGPPIEQPTTPYEVIPLGTRGGRVQHPSPENQQRWNAPPDEPSIVPGFDLLPARQPQQPAFGARPAPVFQPHQPHPVGNYPNPNPPAAYGRRGLGVFAAIAAVLAAVIAVAALVFVLANRSGDGNDNPDVPTLGGAPPSNVRLRDEGTRIAVTWTDPSGGTVSFLVAMAHPGEQLRPVGTLGPGETSFEMSALNATLDYCFAVIAVYRNNKFATSEQACTERPSTGASPN